MLKKTSTGYKFDLLARNGRVVATSEVYLTLASCRVGVASVRRNAPLAGFWNACEPEEKPGRNPRFELYQDRAGEFRFRLRARNGEIIAVSEGYATRSNCRKGIDSVRRNAVKASEVLWEQEGKEDET